MSIKVRNCGGTGGTFATSAGTTATNLVAGNIMFAASMVYDSTAIASATTVSDIFGSTWSILHDSGSFHDSTTNLYGRFCVYWTDLTGNLQPSGIGGVTFTFGQNVDRWVTDLYELSATNIPGIVLNQKYATAVDQDVDPTYVGDITLTNTPLYTDPGGFFDWQSDSIAFWLSGSIDSDVAAFQSDFDSLSAPNGGSLSGSGSGFILLKGQVGNSAHCEMFTYFDGAYSASGLLIGLNETAEVIGDPEVPHVPAWTFMVQGVPAGGSTGYHLEKSSNADYEVTWVADSGIDHGSLGGLSDDDHPQYGALAQNETVTGAWTFSDDITAKQSIRLGGDAAHTDIILNVGSDTNPVGARFYMTNSGTMVWGPGDAGQDTVLYRAAANSLKTDDLFTAELGLSIGATPTGNVAISFPPSMAMRTTAAATGQQAYFDLGTVNFRDGDGTVGGGNINVGGDMTLGDDMTLASGSVLTWAADTNLYRSAANSLATDDDIVIFGASRTVYGGTGTSDIYFGSSANNNLTHLRGGTVNIITEASGSGIERVRFPSSYTMDMGPDMKIQWGSAYGTNDTNLYRAAGSAVLKTDNTLTVGGNLNLDASDTGLAIFWGSTADVKLYRSAANVLKTDDKLIIGLGVDVLGDNIDLQGAAGSGGIYFRSGAGGRIYNDAGFHIKTNPPWTFDSNVEVVGTFSSTTSPTNTPAAISTSGSKGAGLNVAWDDHTHAHEAAHINHDTTWAAKGDIIGGTANDTAAILPVGTDGQVLSADSTQATGLLWVDPTAGSGGTVAIEEGNVTVDLTVATLDFAHGLDVTTDGATEVNIAVDESELDHSLLGSLTTGDPHTQYITKAFVAAKGDIIGASANDTPALTTVGADGTFLKADSGAGSGLSWVDHTGAADPHTGYRLESADHSHQTTGLQGGTLDHGAALTGLSDDDHPQYVLEATAHLSGTVALQGDISDALTADQNDYNPAGLSGASRIRLTANSQWTITGLQGGADGRVIIIHNVDTSDEIFITGEDVLSTAANRFALPIGLDFLMQLNPGESAAFVYDATTLRWRLIGFPGIQVVSVGDAQIRSPYEISFDGNDFTVTGLSGLANVNLDTNHTGSTHIGAASDAVTTHEGTADPHTGYVLESLIDAKGDLYVGSADNTVIRKAVGADDTILMADTAAGGGIKWVASGTPTAITSAADAGTADTYARGDHSHAHEPAHINHDTTWAAKGDLIVGTANDTAAILGIGGNGTVLYTATDTPAWGSLATVGIAPNTVDYLVGTASAGLTSEIVVGATPGGELGGTWASPTVDAVHAGSAHGNYASSWKFS